MKDKNWQNDAHMRLCVGDPTASAEIYNEIIPFLIKQLAYQYPKIPREDIEDIVLDVFMLYILNPKQYDPKGKTLFGYLRMSAEGDIKNFIASARYSRTIQLSEELEHDNVVDISISNWNLYIEDSFVDSIANEDVFSHLLQLANEALPNDNDKKILLLILRGERNTTEYAHILKIEHLPDEEQRLIIKRNTDRIKKVLRRLSGKAKEVMK
jgi:DNA-directed RNA polymerase specialized sigma24 family protein